MVRLEHYPIKKLKRELKNITAKYLADGSYRLFFFGSRVTEKGNEKSDIDVGIEGKKPIPAKMLSKIKEEIENLPILYKIEIVDFANVSPDFKKVAKKKTENI